MNDIIVSEQSLPESISKIELAIAQANTPEQIKHVIALTDAAVAYATRYYKEHREVVEHAKRCKLLAERKLGEILAAMPKAKGTAGTGRPDLGGNKKEPPKSDVSTLADLGIDKRLSARSQQLARLPEREFEEVAAGRVPLSAVVATKKRNHAPTKPTKPAAARLQAVDAALASNHSMLSSYIRIVIKELHAGNPLSAEELRLVIELAEVCGDILRERNVGRDSDIRESVIQ